MRTEKKLKSNKGFTLVELVVVIAVLAILAGVGTVAYRGYITRAQEAADISALAAVKTAVDASLAGTNKTYKTITVTVANKKITEVKTNDGSSDTTIFSSTTSTTDGVQDLYNTFMEGNKDFAMSKNGTWTWQLDTNGNGKWTRKEST